MTSHFKVSFEEWKLILVKSVELVTFLIVVTNTGRKQLRKGGFIWLMV